MKIEQHPYLSPQASELRHRDGIPPWGVHPCEVDSLPAKVEGRTVFAAELAAARELRRQLEAPPAR